jgi:hypothetical protein
MALASLDRLFADAELMPHSIEPEARMTFVHADRQRVEQLPFLDGREPFGTQGPSVRIAQLLSAEWQRPAGPDRFIFHVGFCGSTFLATVLQQASVLALREPHILIDIADAGERDPSAKSIRTVAWLAADLLRRPWRNGEPVICKPSNWCNNLAPLLLAPERDAVAVFLTASPKQYLTASFRGGNARIENIARTAKHMLASAPGGGEQWQTVMASSSDPLERATRLCLLALASHMAAFRSSSGFAEDRLFAFVELESHPMEIASAVASALQLELGAEQIEAALGRVGGVHAKQPLDPYSAADRQSADEAIEAQYGDVIRSAIDWADGNLAF